MRPRVLVIGGTDSSGGAGLLRDAQALGHFGVDAACVVTAITVQSHQHVHDVHCLEPRLVAAQMAAALSAAPISAVKIGMLGNAQIVAAVSDGLRACEVPIVLDPVLASSSGGTLLDCEGRQALLELLMPRATLVTPNRDEAIELLGFDLRDLGVSAGLIQTFPNAVLLKGGHAQGAEAIDWLMCKGVLSQLSAPRLPVSMRGTGCTLASAVAANLARGVPLLAACQSAKAHVHSLLQMAMTQRPVDG